MYANKYDEKLKKIVVNGYHSGKSVAALKEEYKVSSPVIYKWIKESNQELNKKRDLTYYNELEHENHKLKEEISVLKKAMSIMVSN